MSQKAREFQDNGFAAIQDVRNGINTDMEYALVFNNPKASRRGNFHDNAVAESYLPI